MRELAILHYKGSPSKDPDEDETLDPEGLTLNPWNKKMSDLNIPYFLMNSTGISIKIYQLNLPQVSM